MAEGVAPTAAAALERLRARRLARNVPLGESADLNPALTRDSLIGQLLYTWERIFVLCYKETCAVHTEAGAADGRRMWWPDIQQRIEVFDAADLDRQHLEVVRWAGCDLPNRPAGRSGDPVIQEPCTFIQRAGGTDWRRTAKHRLLALLAHLALVTEASRRNLTSVLILEADLVPALAVEELSGDADQNARAAKRIRDAFMEHPWAVARLSAMFYSRDYLPTGWRSLDFKACTKKCACTRWGGDSWNVKHDTNLRICRIAPAEMPADTISPMLKNLHLWCDVRDTAAYAVHRSAFPAFIGYLDRLKSRPHWLRSNAVEVPAIDNWLPHALPCLYFLPTLVSQPSALNSSQGATAMMRQTSARNFLAYCVQNRPSPSHDMSRTGVVPDERRPMKLHQFATRHLYVLKD